MKKAGLLFLVATIMAWADLVPDFSAEDIHGQRWSLNLLLGEKLTVLCFWNVSCAPSKEELELLNAFHEMYEDSGLSVVAINIDSWSTLPKVKPLVESYGWKFTVLVDPYGEVMRLYDVSPIPHIFYVKPDKELLKSGIGFDEKQATDISMTIQNGINGDYSLFFLSAPTQIVTGGEIGLLLHQELNMEVALYDLQGRRVMSIYQGKLSAGFHSVYINTRELADGVYYISATNGEERKSVKLVIIN